MTIKILENNDTHNHLENKFEANIFLKINIFLVDGTFYIAPIFSYQQVFLNVNIKYELQEEESKHYIDYKRRTT
ncbi:hypothetical protein H8356DRAFT_1341401 [Neocallimastix lanati (nom. inval.)]|nr:hypothetical protein H8356DRAFT_1341401 [Neocallimastix sp. JGI-2020a]